MNFRKIIAVMAAMLMLCSILPMGAMVSAASKLDNNFDDGTVGKFKCDSVDTIVAEDGALHWTTQSWKNLYASFSVSANADYKVTFKMKAAAATSMEVKYLNGSWGDSGIAKDTISVGTDWTDYTRILNAGSNNALVLLFQCHKATDVYIDDVKVVDYVAPVDPVFPDNAIYTETFESGSLNGWTNYNSIAETAGLAATKADGGNYAMNFTSVSYSYTNYKLAVEPNTDYKVVFSILSATSGYPINARIRVGNGDLAYTQYTPSTSAWETHSYLFNSGDNSSVNLRFQAGWETGTYYIDNIYVVPFDMSNLADDGHILNGGFETGDAIGWTAGANTEVVVDPTGAENDYVIKTFETGSGTDMFTQTFKNLVAGKTYTISFKVYGYGTATNNAFYVRIPKNATFSNQTGIDAGSSGKTYIARYNLNSNTGKWITASLDFVADAATALIQFQNYRSGQGFYYFDDITITHAYDYVKTVAADCLNDGYDVYACACGATKNENVVTSLGHTWDDATCTAPKTCSVCGATEGDALGHTYTPAETLAPTCGADGVMTYTCACGDSYTEAIPATGEHTYDNEFDADCNVCGAIREVESFAAFGGSSTSEDVNGLAFRFDVAVDGMTTVDDTSTAIYGTGTVNGYTLVSMGAKVSNGKQVLDIPAVYLCDLTETSASFAVRIVEIPDAYKDRVLSAVSYYVLEDSEGNRITIEEEARSASYNEVMAR